MVVWLMLKVNEKEGENEPEKYFINTKIDIVLVPGSF